MERQTACHKPQAAPGAAMTGNGDNDTPVQSQPHAMRAAGREPAGGGTPVEPVRRRSFDDFPGRFGVSRTN